MSIRPRPAVVSDHPERRAPGDRTGSALSLDTTGSEAPWAMPGQVISASVGSSVYAVLHGDIHIRDGHAVYHVMPFSVAGRPVSTPEARRQPSRLLAAESQVVRFAFAARADELAALASWRDNAKAGVSVKLLHGSAGQGKTRLAAEFASGSCARGWTVWTARHLSDPGAQHVIAPGDPGRKLLLIADYADRWPLDDLLLLLRNPLLDRPQYARVLLVARPAEHWWPALRRWLSDEVHEDPAMALSPLAVTMPDRRAIFSVAAEDFARILDYPRVAGTQPPSLPGPAFSSVLSIHMAALVAVDAMWRGGQAPSDPVGLSAYLLDREHDFWQALFDHGQVVTAPGRISRAVYVATLTHPLPPELAVSVMDRMRVAPAVTASVVVKDHATCYPAADATAGTVLEPLYPDRLGEDFLALSAPGHAYSAYRSDPWAKAAPARLLDPGHEPVPAALTYSRPALITLIETASRWPHVANGQLYPILRQQPRLALIAGGAALAALAELDDIDTALLEAIETCIPDHRHVDLDTGIAVLASRLARTRPAATADPVLRARIIEGVGVRLFFAGRQDEALAAMREAVPLHRQLAGGDSAAGDAGLARCLSNLAWILSEREQRAEALAMTEESVAIYRRLARRYPVSFDADLACSLSNLGSRLSEMGRHAEALAAAEQAVEAQRRLVGRGQAGAQADLATSADSLGALLAQLGQHEQALMAAYEAVAIQRELAEAEPQGFEPHLAAVLTNLGMRLSEAGLHEAALGATEESVAIQRRLAVANPAAYEPNLAGVLNNLGSRLRDLRRYPEALVVTEEALTIRRRLATDNPVAYRPDLASSLNNVAVNLWWLGRREESVEAVMQAVVTWRQLAADNPPAFDGRMASALTNLSILQWGIGRRAEALVTADEAVAIARRLAAENPAAFQPNLASSLNNLGIRLARIGRTTEASAATAESVALYRQLAERSPGTHESDLAMAINNLGSRLWALGERDDATGAAEEAVAIYRRVAAASPSAAAPDLAGSLVNLGIRLAGLGRHAEAVAVTEEATLTLRHLVTANAAAFEADLARCLTNLSTPLAAIGRTDQSLAVAQEAATIYRRLADTRPAVFEAELAASLGNLGLRLSETGRTQEALSATQEAVAIRRRLAADDPDGFEQDLARSLSNLSAELASAGRHGEAAAAAAEATRLRDRNANS